MLPITEGYNLSGNSSFALYIVVFLIIYLICLMFNLLFIGFIISSILTLAIYLFQKNSYPGEVKHKMKNKRTPNILYGNRKE